MGGVYYCILKKYTEVQLFFLKTDYFSIFLFILYTHNLCIFVVTMRNVIKM